MICWKRINPAWPLAFLGIAALAYLILPSAPLAALASQSQPAPVTDAVLVVHAGGRELKLTPTDWAALPRATIRVKDHDSQEVAYEGVLARELLTRAGVQFGQSLRGPRLADYLVASGANGYRVVVALPELDADFSDRIVLIADRETGQPLSARDGPLRLVISDERKHARWVRDVRTLSVRTAAD